MVNREQFDFFLFRSARQRGVTVQDGEAIEHVLSTSDEVIVQTSQNEYRAKVLIAADGANSTVRGQLGLSRVGRVMAAMELHAPHSDISAPNLVDNMALIDLSLMNRGVPGYGWVFPAVGGGSQPAERWNCDSAVRSQKEYSTKRCVCFLACHDRLGSERLRSKGLSESSLRTTG